MSDKPKKENQNENAGWPFKLAILLIVFLASVYICLMAGFGWRNNNRDDTDILQLNTESFCTSRSEISNYAGIRKGYTIPITKEFAARDDIGIWLVHNYVDIYIGTERVYYTREPRAAHVGHSPGCYWVFVPIRSTDVGKTMRMVVTPAYAEVTEREPLICLGRRDLITGTRLLEEAAIVVVALMCIIVGVVFLVITTSMKQELHERGVVFYLGLMLLFLGAWKLTDTPAVYALLLPFDAFLTDLSLVFLMLMTPALSEYLFYLRPEEWVYRWANKAYLILDAVLLLLQVLDIRDLRQNLLLIQVSILVFIVVMLEKNIYSLRKNDGYWHKWAFILIGIGSLGDLVIYIYGFNSFYMGITLTAILFYGIVNGVMLLIKASRRGEEMRRKDVQLRESHMRLMMSQIRPHFIYNTLNAIYVLCGKDPEGARKAIYDFSKYLRINFEHMDRTEPVAFKEELQHVKFYLSIEQLRFPDALQVEYDIKETDFTLPALSLQPIVENAVRHGIRGKNTTGTIKISSFTENGGAYVVVEDDGEGFDVAAWEKNIRESGGEGKDGRRHVGLANVRDRMQEYGGRLVIESKVGKGTQMILCIPIAEKGEDAQKADKKKG